MKYRIKKAESISGKEYYYPQYRYRFLPLWFYCTIQWHPDLSSIVVYGNYKYVME